MFRKTAFSFLALVLACMPAYADPIITGAIPNTFTPGSVISSSQMNADFQYLIAQINANAAKNGANSSITSLSALSTPLTLAQGGSNIFIGGTATGTATAIVVASAIPTGYTLSAGNTIRFIAAFSSTGATTLAVNGTTATNVFRQTPSGLQALTGGEILAGTLTEAYYDGVQYEILGSAAQQGGYGALNNLAASATPDLGTVPTHNVNLTGGPFTITSFGSSANTAYPMYLVRFNAINPMTNSANLNLLGAPVTRTTAVGDQGVYFYSGAGVWYELAYYPAKPHYAPTMVNALTVKNNTATPTTKIDVTAAEIVLDNSAGVQQYVDSYYGGGACTIDLTVNGSSGLDTGAVAANTWYNVFATGDGGANTNCIASVSATAPTLPAGTPFKMRLGAIRTSSAAATLWPVYQVGNITKFTGPLAVIGDKTVIANASGTCGANVTTATVVVWGTFIPATAKAALLSLNVNNSQVGVFQSALVAAVPLNTTGVLEFSAGWLQQEYMYTYNGSTSINECSQLASSIYTNGWIDTVNAN